MAKNYNVRPILTLTPLDSSGSFNNNLITSVVNNSYATDNLINNLINQLNTFEYKGVDIDFEYIKEEDKDAFSSFVASVTSALNEYGYIVSVALAPKTVQHRPDFCMPAKIIGHSVKPPTMSF